MSTKKILLLACGLAAGLALAPAIASAAVKFDSVTLSASTSAVGGTDNNAKTPSKTYTSLAKVKAGVSKTTESTASQGGGKADAINQDQARFVSKKEGVLGINQSAETAANKNASSASADASGEVDYQFELTGPKTYGMALFGLMSGSTTGDNGFAGDLVAQIYDKTTSTFVFASTGGSFGPVVTNLTAGTYILELLNSGDSSSRSAGKGDADSGGAFGLLAFDIAAVPEPSSWALMILGLAGAGAMLRRQRRLTVATAA